MLNTLAVANYRSINKLVIPLGRLNLITGPNGSGKSNLYRALHPDLLPALARLIIRASENCQVWVVSHATRLIAALEQDEQCNCIVPEKDPGQTGIVGQRALDEPAWHWPD